jgi:hypothetical protein
MNNRIYLLLSLLGLAMGGVEAAAATGAAADARKSKSELEKEIIEKATFSGISGKSITMTRSYPDDPNNFYQTFFLPEDSGFEFIVKPSDLENAKKGNPAIIYSSPNELYSATIIESNENAYQVVFTNKFEVFKSELNDLKIKLETEEKKSELILDKSKREKFFKSISIYGITSPNLILPKIPQTEADELIDSLKNTEEWMKSIDKARYSGDYNGDRARIGNTIRKLEWNSAEPIFELPEGVELTATTQGGFELDMMRYKIVTRAENKTLYIRKPNGKELNFSIEQIVEYRWQNYKGTLILTETRLDPITGTMRPKVKLEDLMKLIGK